MNKLNYVLVAIFVYLLAACSVNNESLVRAEGSGFGGTGIVTAARNGNSGFGGTGIVGTIDAFGSIWVNGIEVDYSDDVKVSSNLDTQEPLKLGQQVYLETDQKLSKEGRPTTQYIGVFYPIAGKIEAVLKSQVQVQGQTIKINKETLMDAGLNIEQGQFVKVNAFKDDNGQWIATRLNANPRQIQHYQEQMPIQFSDSIKQVVVQPELARMQWPHLFKNMRSQVKEMRVIGQWNHMNNELERSHLQLFRLQHIMRDNRDFQKSESLKETRELRHHREEVQDSLRFNKIKDEINDFKEYH